MSENEKNIILIGLSGSGKTAFSKQIAEKFGMERVDMDNDIAERAGKSIADIFAQDGETVFRDLETECAKRCGRMKNAVISTGGGIILREENMKALKENGTVIFLDRKPEDIIGEDLSDRPLVADDQNKIYCQREERLPLYQKYADYTVHNCKEKADTIRLVFEAVDNILEKRD